MLLIIISCSDAPELVLVVTTKLLKDIFINSITRTVPSQWFFTESAGAPLSYCYSHCEDMKSGSLVLSSVMWVLLQSIVKASFVAHSKVSSSAPLCSLRMMTTADGTKKGKLLVLGGTGFLGQTICKRALVEGYQVTSVSRRGVLPDASTSQVDYRKGDARQEETIINILNEGGYTGVIHCIGLLFDDESGLGNFNRFVSGSKSVPDSQSSYDSITRVTAFNAIDATVEYCNKNNMENFPFCFTSAAEAGWPEMTGGTFIETNLAPDWLRRYLVAKRAVEEKLLSSSPPLRPIIVRPSLIYSLDRPLSFPSVGAFFVGNKIGLPFVDRPVSVQALSCAVVRSMDRPSVQGIQRFREIDVLNE